MAYVETGPMVAKDSYHKTKPSIIVPIISRAIRDACTVSPRPRSLHGRPVAACRVPSGIPLMLALALSVSDVPPRITTGIRTITSNGGGVGSQGNPRSERLSRAPADS